MKGNKNYFELAGVSSYRGFELPTVNYSKGNPGEIDSGSSQHKVRVSEGSSWSRLQFTQLVQRLFMLKSIRRGDFMANSLICFLFSNSCDGNTPSILHEQTDDHFLPLSGPFARHSSQQPVPGSRQQGRHRQKYKSMIQEKGAVAAIFEPVTDVSLYLVAFPPDR